MNEDEWVAKIARWSDETQKLNLTQRQHTDSWAELMRPRTIEMLEGFMRLGWMDTAEDRVVGFRLALDEVGFDLTPDSGWPAFGFELDLVLIAMKDVTDSRTISNAELAKKIENDLRKLDDLKTRFYELNHTIEFSVAAMMAEADVNQHIPNIEQMITSLETVREWLIDNTQAPRWREKGMRNFRVEMAIKLSTLFETEFERDAKPDGGSEALPLEESNPWTRFFQACAIVRMGERASPDRQAVLWEAYRSY